MAETTAYAAAIAGIAPDLSYSAEFVPWKLSRNAGEKSPSLNWKITLKTPRGSLTTDYMQGIGHLPGYKHGPKSIMQDELERVAADSGKLPGRGVFAKPLAAPALADVLHSLLLDAEALDSATFEDWACDLGYDTDSRKAESIYRACLAIGLKLRRMLGDETIAALREALRDL